jgi:F-box protein 9
MTDNNESKKTKEIESEKQETWLDSEWELTWPIWHMLPRDERKHIALQHNMKTIGEFEEYMTLQRAMHAAEDRIRLPYDNEEIYGSKSIGKEEAKRSQAKQDKARKEEDDDGDNSDDDDQLDERIESDHISAADRLPSDELVKLGGYLLLLPDEMLHRCIFEWLPVDAYGVLARVSPHWKSFTRTEAVYKRLCERLYLNQSKRRQLHVGRFKNSYRTMLELRPRVRAGGGVYVMRYSRVKPIVRDMWTEVSNVCPVSDELRRIYILLNLTH